MNDSRSFDRCWLVVSAVVALGGCGAAGSTGGSTGSGPGRMTTSDGGAHDPGSAPMASIDRFSADAGTLMVRNATNGLPAANAPIDYDQPPFITQGLGPSGQAVQYYNFDVRPLAPAPIYVFFESGSTTPVANQLNVIDALPGDSSYNDFWQVMAVTVPAGYVANTIASLAELTAAGYAITPSDMLVNCPVVPAGSTATQRLGGGSAALMQGWYRDEIVDYFTFGEAPLAITSNGQVPVSGIFVTFNVNPGQAGGGPASGFMTASGTTQTHNVVATVPGNGGYSPLWSVSIYDDADFSSVTNLATAQAATSIGPGPLVNCPVVSVN